MKPTALSELIQFYHKIKSQYPDGQIQQMLIDKITSLQQKEMEQIVEAYEQRATDQYEGLLRTGFDYYKKTYL